MAKLAFLFIIKYHLTTGRSLGSWFYYTFIPFHLHFILQGSERLGSNMNPGKTSYSYMIFLCVFCPPCQWKWVRFLFLFFFTKYETPKLLINPSQAPYGGDSFCWWMMLERTQEGSWKWVPSIILGPVSWLVAGMVSCYSCLLGRLSQNPGMVSKNVDVTAWCHLGTGIDKMTKITLCAVQMDRIMSLGPAVVAAPDPSAKDEWFPVPCTNTPAF